VAPDAPVETARAATVRARAGRWLEIDPDPATRAELQALLDAGDDAELEARFSGTLTFGTAGLRGEIGAGPMRMNRVVVRNATAGVAARLAADREPAASVVVVGRDARHGSEAFARDAVAVLAARGFDVRQWATPVPTPLLAYVTRLLGAVAGIQITASHNPAADNGYKVYWAGGAQITPDLADEIATEIAAAETPVDLPDPDVRALPDDLVDAYRTAALRLLPQPAHRDLSIVYTPLHGVAGEEAVALLRAAGFADVSTVTEQFAPDPDFPTLDFPNPEEPGALDAATALARERGADLLLANDPDGDRIAAAVPAADGWRLLTGDEIGCLLADYLLDELPGGGERFVATTVVSSQLLARIAEAHGVAYAETLTGFKWLAAAVADAERDGRRPVLAYEEALGVMVGDAVRDKDGLSAALVLADCAARERARGRSLPDRLDDLARRHGLHAKAQTYIRFEQDERDLAGDALRQLRDASPDRIAGSPVVAVTDYEQGERRERDGTVAGIAQPPTRMVGLALEDGSRMQVRPSGTEPKLKFYVEVVEPVADGDVDAARGRAGGRLATVVEELYDAAGIPPGLRS
jgi:phosphomannomutase